MRSLGFFSGKRQFREQRSPTRASTALIAADQYLRVLVSATTAVSSNFHRFLIGRFGLTLSMNVA